MSQNEKGDVRAQGEKNYNNDNTIVINTSHNQNDCVPFLQIAPFKYCTRNTKTQKPLVLTN